jgi:DNA-binding Lrp family transcriptional regulator
LDHWTFLTNHGHILLAIAEDPGIRMRDAARRVGITERAAQRIIADLLEEGYLSREKVGRRNRYELHGDLPLRHPLAGGSSVSVLLKLVTRAERAPRRRPAAKPVRARS